MPTTKHELLDWLMDVPDDAEVGTDGAGLALLAILGANVHFLVRIPVIVSSDSGANVSTIPVHREHDSGAS